MAPPLGRPPTIAASAHCGPAPPSLPPRESGVLALKGATQSPPPLAAAVVSTHQGPTHVLLPPLGAVVLAQRWLTQPPQPLSVAALVLSLLGLLGAQEMRLFRPLSHSNSGDSMLIARAAPIGAPSGRLRRGPCGPRFGPSLESRSGLRHRHRRVGVRWLTPCHPPPRGAMSTARRPPAPRAHPIF